MRAIKNRAAIFRLRKKRAASAAQRNLRVACHNVHNPIQSRFDEPYIFSHEDSIKTITICGLTVILLIGWTTSVFAQNTEAERAMMNTPVMRQAEKDRINSERIDFWNGNVSILAATGLLNDNDFRKELGITDEQIQTIQNARQTIGRMSIIDGRSVAYDPDVQLIEDEKEKLLGDRYLYAENVSEETRKEVFDLNLIMGEIVSTKTRDVINETLTPDQLRKAHEFHLAAMSEFSYVSPSMYEVLDLSDEQKEQLAEIKKEMDAEFKKTLDKHGEVQLKFSKIMQEKIDKKLEGVTDPEERLKIMTVPGRHDVWETHPDLKREFDEANESVKIFSNELKVKILDILTDEQWERLQKLVDNPPDYVKKILRKWRGDSEPTVWTPGPNSWQPGDPIPEAYRQERKTRGTFPRPKQPSP